MGSGARRSGISGNKEPCSCPSWSVGRFASTSCNVAGGVAAGGLAPGGVSSAVGARNGPVAPPIAPPRRPAATPTSMYSLIASSSSSGKPACARSRICCVISVGTSTAAPAPANCADRTNRFLLRGMLSPNSLPVRSSLSPMVLSTAEPPAARNASIRSLPASSPAAICCSWRWMLRP